MFGVKEPIPGGLRSRVVYKFTCAGCNACHVDETVRHFSMRVKEHLASDRASHIFQHLQNSEHCCALCSVDLIGDYILVMVFSGIHSSIYILNFLQNFEKTKERHILHMIDSPCTLVSDSV